MFGVFLSCLLWFTALLSPHLISFIHHTIIPSLAPLGKQARQRVVLDQKLEKRINILTKVMFKEGKKNICIC